MRSKLAIDREIAALKKIRVVVRPTSAFGDDHHAAIDAQIEVLEDRRDEGFCWDRWPRDEEDMTIRGHAQEAVWWLREENGQKDPPSKGWLELCPTKTKAKKGRAKR